MKEFILVTDSTSDLPIDIIKKHNILIMPLKYHIDDKTYYNDILNPKQTVKGFYDQVKEGALPTTSQLNPSDYEQFLVPLLKEGKDILILSFSNQLSGTYNSGRMAVMDLSEKYPNSKLKIIDTLGASLGEGLIVYLAALKKAEGATFDEVAAYVDEIKLKVAHWFTVNDISHLRRGGRISGLSTVIAKTLNIKPIMHTSDEGKLIPRKKAIGRRKAIRSLYQEMKSSYQNVPQIIFIGHGDDLDAANQLKDLIVSDNEINVKELIISPIGPVIGAHTGQGVLALFFLANNR